MMLSRKQVWERLKLYEFPPKGYVQIRKRRDEHYEALQTAAQLTKWLEFCWPHKSSCEGCPAMILGPVGGCRAQDWLEDER